MNNVRKLIGVVCASIILALSLNVSDSLAFSTNDDGGPRVQLSQEGLTVETGKSGDLYLDCSDYVKYFIMDATSKDTTVSLELSDNGFHVTVNIGEDEEAYTIPIHFYIHDQDDTYTTLYVTVVHTYVYDPDKAVADSDRVAVAIVPLIDGSIGTVSLINDYKVAYFQTAEGLPIAQFSFYADNGKMRKMSLGDTVLIDNISYVTVTTTTEGTIRISDSDKIALQTFGIGGVILNGVITTWP